MTEPKPNIRPGVRGICRNGFWTPPLESTAHYQFPWQAGPRAWMRSGCVDDSSESGWDIIGIVEDLPTVPSPQSSNDITPKQFDEIGVLLEEIDELKADAAKWREHVANPQPAPQIPGMPEGWEVDPELQVIVNGGDGRFQHQIRIPIRRIKPPEPACKWQHGVFRDGWLSQNENQPVRWSEREPHKNYGTWYIDSAMVWCDLLACEQPKFRDDLPWDQRIVKVGPEAEKELAGK